MFEFFLSLLFFSDSINSILNYAFFLAALLFFLFSPAKYLRGYSLPSLIFVIILLLDPVIFWLYQPPDHSSLPPPFVTIALSFTAVVLAKSSIKILKHIFSFFSTLGFFLYLLYLIALLYSFSATFSTFQLPNNAALLLNVLSNGLIYKPLSFLLILFFACSLYCYDPCAPLASMSVARWLACRVPRSIFRLIPFLVICSQPSRSSTVGFLAAAGLMHAYNSLSSFVNLNRISSYAGALLSVITGISLYLIYSQLNAVISSNPWLLLVDPRLIIWSRFSSIFSQWHIFYFVGPGIPLVDNVIDKLAVSSAWLKNSASYLDLASTDPRFLFLTANIQSYNYNVGFESDLLNLYVAYGLVGASFLLGILILRSFVLLRISTRLPVSLFGLSGPFLFQITLSLFLSFCLEDRGSYLLSWYLVVLALFVVDYMSATESPF